MLWENTVVGKYLDKTFEEPILNVMKDVTQKQICFRAQPLA